jgi:PAS domain S-box-containing protein
MIADSQKPSKSKTLKILYVEDRVPDMELALKELQRAGIGPEVKRVEREEDFIRELESSACDLILSDYRLPGWNGMDALKAVTTRNLNIPFILVSGTVGEDAAVECIKSGAWDYVLKDNLQRLPLAVKRALRDRQEAALRMQAEEKLRESEMQYRLLFEANPNPMWVYDIDTTQFLQVNQATVEQYGFTREEFLSMTIKDIRPQEELQRFLAEYEVWDKTSNIDGGMWIHSKKDGTRMTVQVTSRALTFQGRNARLVLGVDITEKLEAEKQRWASQELFATVFHSNPEGITISTFDEGRYLEVNPSFSKIVGFERDELLGKTALELGIWRRKEDRARLFEQIRENKPLIGFETEFTTKSGNVRQVQISAAHIQFQGIKCLLGHIRDVTDQKTLEHQFRQAQKMESVGRLASGVAHDFNNLLMVIGSSAEMLEEIKDFEKAGRHIAQIRSATNKAASLTRQLLAFSRQQVLQPKVLELNRVVEDLWKMLPRLMGEDVEMIKALDPAAGRVSADPGQLEQVIMNLAVNARDAMPKGGKLILETSNVAVDENYVRRHSVEMKPGPYVVLALTDTGIGMDAATQTRIFEPFFTTKEVGKGTGLGLATVYGIVKQSNGFIWVYSEPGLGTTFKVYFPRNDAPVEASRELPVGPVQAVGTKTILLAEDEPVLRESIAEYLRARGYEVLEAGSGPAAVGVCETHRGSIDLLITDAIMPGFGGQQVAKRVSERYPAIRIVYTSGYTDRALDPGINGPRAIFLQKPFSLQVLGETVRRLLG